MLNNCQNGVSQELLVVIVNRGKGSRVLKIARASGVSGGTIALGRGTFMLRHSFWLDSYDVRKDIVLMLANHDKLQHAMTVIDEQMELSQPNHGIGFLVPICAVIGSLLCRMNKDSARKGEHAMMQAIFTIVETGTAETVVRAAESAGSRGATILNARGAGVHETSRLFSMDIEPEKEIVLILADNAVSEAIMEAIRGAVGLDEPGHGLLFAMDVTQTYGM